jgi:tetratricopeptide (TPR) repeat protein/tRNA A-37 threonylcarbamoyl transferase component Bud32
MNICGLTDSLATLHAAPDECPHCHTTSRVGRGLCLSCLLLVGAQGEDDLTDGEFEAALAALPVADTFWRLGNYEILEEIGRGGMGVIYRARQRHSRRIVALKRVLGYHADSRETLARFRREAEAAASLDHPNILPIYEVGESEDGVPFFSMKFAPGGSLQEAGPALRDNPREIVRLLAKVTRAVQCAHRRGILHRDLKPGNILLDGRGEPLVSDFGLAKWLDASSDLTRTLTIFGTPGYIAPEQAEGNPDHVKPATDVYSLGAILFVLLTGRPPFLGEHAFAVIRQAANNPAPKLRTLVKGGDKDLETICARCLEREATARYSSAGDLAEDLERWLEGRPIIARPVSPPTRVWRWARRNPLLAGTIAGCALLAIVAGAREFQTWQLQGDVTARIAAQHSVEVEPVFDLDNVREDEKLTAVLTNELRGSLASIGPSVVTPKTDSTAGRSIVSATVRSLDGKRRLALRLLDRSSRDLLFHQLCATGGTGALRPSDLKFIGSQIYSLLNALDLSAVAEKNNDPGLRDKEASDFITAASELYDGHSQLDLDRAEVLLRHALAREPKSSRAYSQLARVLSTKAAYTSDRRFLPEAATCARQAIALDSGNGEAYQMLSAVDCQLGRFREAIAQIQLAFECKGLFSRGGDIIAQTYATIGRPDMAVRWLLLGQKSEPHPGENEASIGDVWSLLAEDDQAEKCYKRFSELHPEKPDGWMCLARVLVFLNQPDKARAICNQNWKHYTDFAYSEQMAAEVEFFTRHFPEATALYRELYAGDPDGGGKFYGAISYRSALGRLEPEKEKARALLQPAREAEEKLLRETPDHPESLYRLAAVEATLGQIAPALEHLHRAFNAGWIDYQSPRFDPRFDSLRGDGAFTQLTATMEARVAALRRFAPTDKLQPPTNNEENKP